MLGKRARSLGNVVDTEQVGCDRSAVLNALMDLGNSRWQDRQAQ